MRTTLTGLLLFVMLTSCVSQYQVEDGTYSTTTPEDHEKMLANLSLTFQNNRVVQVYFQIYDNRHHMAFDEDYEEIMGNNQHYREQCRINLAAIEEYKSQFLDSQRIEEVDAISGASWAHGHFHRAVNQLMDELSVE